VRWPAAPAPGALQALHVNGAIPAGPQSAPIRGGRCGSVLLRMAAKVGARVWRASSMITSEAAFCKP